MSKKRWWEYSSLDLIRKKRQIFLFEDITNKTAKDVIIEMQAMVEANSKESIWLYINSVGGYIPAGLAIIDFMERIKLVTRVYTVAIGEVCSMGSLIFICGSHRFITANSYFMGHPASFGINDYSGFVKDRVNYYFDLEKRLERIYKEHTKLTKRDLEKMKNGELWLNAKQCIKKGVADEIL